MRWFSHRRQKGQVPIEVLDQAGEKAELREFGLKHAGFQ
jgi:hypothetical protein